MTSTQKPAAKPTSLVAAAVAAGKGKKATPPVTKYHGYGVFQDRATGVFAVLTYTPQGKEADWIMVAPDEKTVIARAPRMKDVWAALATAVEAGKIKKLDTPVV